MIAGPYESDVAMIGHSSLKSAVVIARYSSANQVTEALSPTSPKVDRRYLKSIDGRNAIKHCHLSIVLTASDQKLKKK